MGSDDERVDVLRYETRDGPQFRAIEAGRAQGVVRAHEEEYRKRRLIRKVFLGCIALAGVGYGFFVSRPLVGALGGVVVIVAVWFLDEDDREEVIPTVVDENVPRRAAERSYPLADE